MLCVPINFNFNFVLTNMVEDKTCLQLCRKKSSKQTHTKRFLTCATTIANKVTIYCQELGTETLQDTHCFAFVLSRESFFNSSRNLEPFSLDSVVNSKIKLITTCIIMIIWRQIFSVSWIQILSTVFSIEIKIRTCKLPMKDSHYLHISRKINIDYVTPT